MKRGREEPFLKNRDVVGACEEALVKFAFARHGVVLDYVSQEILRRWTKDLGVANFSYYVPRFEALRFWPTAEVQDSDGEIAVTRRIWLRNGSEGDRTFACCVWRNPRVGRNAVLVGAYP